MGKRVKITTKDGTEYFRYFNQEIEKVEIIEEKPFSDGIMSAKQMSQVFHEISEKYGTWLFSVEDKGDKYVIRLCGHSIRKDLNKLFAEVII